jgi:hypothetical protein
MPSHIPLTRFAPASFTADQPCFIPLTMFAISCGATSSNFQNEPTIPATNFPISSPPAFIILGKFLINASINFCIISGAFSINIGIAFISPFC